MNRFVSTIAAAVVLGAMPTGLSAHEPKVATRKAADRVAVEIKVGHAIHTITSPSGIGGATIAPGNGWPKKVTLRLRLRGLESLRLSTGKVDFRASVLSHGGNARLLHMVENGQERKIEKGSPYWMEIRVLNAQGMPVRGLPKEGGCFEVELPTVLFEDKPKSLAIEWIDFYRR